jgi:hypothetical protein
MNLVAQITISNSDVNIPQGDLGTSQIRTILRIAFGMGGALAMLIIVVAGLRFVTSQGDPAAVTRSRQAVIYAVVGLVVCAMGFSIVTFVIGHI